MTSTTSEALRHKIEKRAAAAPVAVGGVKRAFRMAVARAGLEFSNLVMSMTDYAEREQRLDAILPALNDCPMLLAIGRGEEELGLFLMDMPLILGLLEHLTTGRVIRGDAEARQPTRTDAILLSDLVNSLLSLIAEEISELANTPDLAGFRYDRLLADARAAEMALEEGAYLEYELKIELDGGAKTGNIRMLFPKASPGTGQAPRRQDWSKAWREQVDKVEVRVEAVLYRTRMSLNQVTHLQVGDLVEVPIERISRVAVMGGNGKIMARGKLGRQGVHRAIRIGADEAGQSLGASAAGQGFGGMTPVSGTGAAGGLPGPAPMPEAPAGAAPQPAAPGAETPDAGVAGADMAPAPMDLGSMAPLPGELEGAMPENSPVPAEAGAEMQPAQPAGGTLPTPMPMKIAPPGGGG